MKYYCILFFILGVLTSTVILYLYNILNITSLTTQDLICKEHPISNPEADYFHRLIDEIFTENKSDTILIFATEYYPLYTDFQIPLVQQEYFDCMFELGAHRLYLVICNIVIKLYNYDGTDLSVVRENKEAFGLLLKGLLYKCVDIENKYSRMERYVYLVVDKFIKSWCKATEPKTLLLAKQALVSNSIWYKDLQSMLLSYKDIREIHSVCLINDTKNKVLVTVFDYILIAIQNVMVKTI